jgi:Ice-binding-like
MGKFIASATLIGALFIVRSNSMALPVDLGTAGPNNWSVLEVGDGSVVEQVDLSNPQGGISGNVGIQKNGKIQGSGPAINGDLYLGDSSSAQFSGTYANNQPITGTVHLGSGATVSPNSYSFTTVSDSPQTLLSQTRIDAINASSAAQALTPTSSLTQINLSNTTMTLAPGVYDLSTFHLDHATLTLTGTGSFVFNISSIFTLNSGQILLAGGATEQNVLFNYTGTSNVAFSGGGNSSVLHGIILALNGQVQLSPGLVVGEVISGKNISIVSGAIVEGVPGGGGQGGRPVPDGSSTFVLLSLSLGGLVFSKHLISRATPVGRIA